MVRQQIRSPDGIDYQEVVLEKMVFHHILVLEMATKKDQDGSAILDCMLHSMSCCLNWACEIF